MAHRSSYNFIISLRLLYTYRWWNKTFVLEKKMFSSTNISLGAFSCLVRGRFLKPCPHWRLQLPNSATILASVDRTLVYGVTSVCRISQCGIKDAVWQIFSTMIDLWLRLDFTHLLLSFNFVIVILALYFIWLCIWLCCIASVCAHLSVGHCLSVTLVHPLSVVR